MDRQIGHLTRIDTFRPDELALVKEPAEERLRGKLLPLVERRLAQASVDGAIVVEYAAVPIAEGTRLYSMIPQAFTDHALASSVIQKDA
jgi:hypothetical protein